MTKRKKKASGFKKTLVSPKQFTKTWKKTKTKVEREALLKAYGKARKEQIAKEAKGKIEKVSAKEIAISLRKKLVTLPSGRMKSKRIFKQPKRRTILDF